MPYSYPSVPLYNVLAGIQGRAVLNQGGANPLQLQALIGLAASRLFAAWNYYSWPYLTPIEGRYFYPVWAGGSTYTAGQTVFYSGTLIGYFTATGTTTAGQSPDTNPTLWARQSGGIHLSVSFTQPGQTAFDTVLGAWDRDPMACDAAVPVPYSITEEGVSFRQDFLKCSNQVWLRFRLPPPNLGGAVLYDASAAYAVGVNVYYSGAGFGDVYTVLIATSAGNTPVSTPTKFALVPFPAWLQRAVEIGALADWLRGDGQGDKAQQLEGNEESQDQGTYNGALNQAVRQLVTVQGQQGRFQFGVRPRRRCY